MEVSRMIANVVEQESQRQGVEAAVILGIMEQESHFNVMVKDAGKGCIGLMQINPRFHEKYDSHSIHGNIYHGTKIIKDLQNQGFLEQEVLKRYHGRGSDGRYETQTALKIRHWRRALSRV
jgi:soluble lytic murein transglycosylase-like protein